MCITIARPRCSTFRLLAEVICDFCIEKGYVELIELIYERASAAVRIEEEGHKFPIGQGVKQEDPLSPLLFNSVLEEIFRLEDISKFGVNIDGENLAALIFADDIVFMSNSIEKLQQM